MRAGQTVLPHRTVGPVHTLAAEIVRRRGGFGRFGSLGRVGGFGSRGCVGRARLGWFGGHFARCWRRLQWSPCQRLRWQGIVQGERYGVRPGLNVHYAGQLGLDASD